MKYRIQIVEDEQIISQKLQEYLEKWEYEVEITNDFASVKEHFIHFEPHLVLLDIGLPFFNGYHWCAEIRKFSKVPIVFLSSASDQMNIVMAMNMGGDDFITKPFDVQVLVAKVQALLRRTYDFKAQMGFLEHKGIMLNLLNTTLQVGTEKVELTKNEFRILELLFQNKERIVSREELMKRLWDNECFIDDNTLTVNMTRLRKKLDEVGLGQLIVTKKGLGYLLEG
ncbi:MAG: response regulator transcription factor [Cellulosilyticum sp.]|nr:response regulator transcription factor [Cellulosilyticum sp.]